MRLALLKVFALFAIIIFVFSSCKDKKELSSEILVEVGTENLSKAELRSMMPSGLSVEDSTFVSEQLIRSWIDEQLLYLEAAQKLKDTSDIHKRIDQYRKELYVHQLNEILVAENIDTVVTAEEIEEYYNTYLNEYILEEPVLKVHYLTMSSQVIGYYVERDMIKTTQLDNIERLIDFCKGTGRRVHITDSWIKISELEKMIPCIPKITNESLVQTKYYECFDEITRYLLMVDESINSGEYCPIELLSPVIHDIILNKRMSESLNIFRQDLYLHAKSNGTLVINY